MMTKSHRILLNKDQVRFSGLIIYYVLYPMVFGDVQTFSKKWVIGLTKESDVSQSFTARKLMDSI